MQGPQGAHRDGHLEGGHRRSQVHLKAFGPPLLQPPEERQRLHAPEAQPARPLQQQHQEDQAGHQVPHGRDEVQRLRLGDHQVSRR